LLRNETPRVHTRAWPSHPYTDLFIVEEKRAQRQLHSRSISSQSQSDCWQQPLGSLRRQERGCFLDPSPNLLSEESHRLQLPLTVLCKALRDDHNITYQNIPVLRLVYRDGHMCCEPVCRSRVVSISLNFEACYATRLSPVAGFVQEYL